MLFELVVLRPIASQLLMPREGGDDRVYNSSSTLEA